MITAMYDLSHSESNAFFSGLAKKRLIFLEVKIFPITKRFWKQVYILENFENFGTFSIAFLVKLTGIKELHYVFGWVHGVPGLNIS